MDRRNCLKRFAELGLCSGMLSLLETGNGKLMAEAPAADEIAALKAQKEFVQNWLADLLATMDKVLDRETIVKLMAGCGRGCFERHSFKQEIAAQGKGDLEKLIAAYKQNFEIWKEGEAVHVRYGETSPGCYCPAANYRPARPTTRTANAPAPRTRRSSRPPWGGRSGSTSSNRSAAAGRLAIF